MKPIALRRWNWRGFDTKLPSRVFAIAAGEGTARLSNLLLAVFVSRTFGVRAAGAYALALALSLYMMQGIDFGLRHAGARMLGQEKANVAQIVRFIQRRRIALTLLIVVLGYCYGAAGPVPKDTRAIVSLYALSIVGYGFSLDWMAWGMQRFLFMSGWRALVSLLCTGVTIFAVQQFHTGMLILPLANALAYFVADSLLWLGWARKHVRMQSPEATSVASLKMPDWKSTVLLGVALLVNQAFNSIDTMMLGSLTDSSETGLYSAAYRLLLLVLAIYYLVMQAVYPQLAALPEKQRSFGVLRKPLTIAIAAGLGAAVVLGVSRGPLVELLYGRAFAPSAVLAGPLVFAIPLDFVTSLLITALVAWDHPRRVLTATTTAVISNVALNCFLIPRYKAMGAAFATPLSYLPYLAMLLWQMRQVSTQKIYASDGIAENAGSSPAEERA